MVYNKKLKDSVFRELLQDEMVCLEIYNSLNNSNYTDPKLIKITTLSNAIVLSKANDASFIIGITLNLYEHQSTINLNMPLRMVIYYVNQLEGILNEELLYKKKIIPLPIPKFVVFYNGEKKLIIEPNKELVMAMRTVAPHKVHLD